MLVREIRVRNFRCVRDASLTLDSSTALLGRNGAGKSTFLYALQMFFSSQPRLSIDDFFDRDVGSPIQIDLTFDGLGPEATTRFRPYLTGNTLEVSRVLRLDTQGGPTAHYYGSRLRNPDFATVRGASSKTEKRARYGELRASGPYVELPSARSAEEAEQHLATWESANPDRCVRSRDEGQFFGVSNVAQGYLADFTRFVLVPAVRDASSEAQDGRGSALTELLDVVVRTSLLEDPRLNELRERTAVEYAALVRSAEHEAKRTDLQNRLATALRSYVPLSNLRLDWESYGEVEIKSPQVGVRIADDDYASDLTRSGHGLQRAFVLALLQELAHVRADPLTSPDADLELRTEADSETNAQASRPTERPDLLLAIEEPELYQHPNRQRFIANVLSNLAGVNLGGSIGTTQVVFATHSPLMVSIDNFDRVRLIRKDSQGPDAPLTTTVSPGRGEALAEALWEAYGRVGPEGAPLERFTWQTLRPRLRPIMTPWLSEGFFSDVVVLVEGEDDRAAILGYALAHGVSLDGHGVSVVPCMGKANLDRPALIFKSLGIPTFVAWDEDSRSHRGDNPRLNLALSRIVTGGTELVGPGVGPSWACFSPNLDRMLESELGPEFSTKLAAVADDLGYADVEHARKNPEALSTVIAQLHAGGKDSASLGLVLGSIQALLPIRRLYSPDRLRNADDVRPVVDASE
jgi:putative ATP-dependent endonuclease of OLD family